MISLGISVKDGGESALSPRPLVGLQLLAQKGVRAYFNLCQREEKAKRKTAKCQRGTRKGAGEMQREARERGGTRGVQEWLQAGSGLGSRQLQPTWSCGVRGNRTLRTFPINILLHQRNTWLSSSAYPPSENDLGKTLSGPSISGQEPTICSVQVSSPPCLSSSPTLTPPTCHPKGYCRGRRKLGSKDSLRT